MGDARERDLHAEIAVERGRAALRQNEQRLEIALKAGRLGSWELDLATNRVTASDICRANFGLGPSDVVETQEDLLCRIHPDDLERRGRAVSEAIETGSPRISNTARYGLTGRLPGRNFAARLSTPKDGTPLRFVGVSLDVTTRKLAEAQQALLVMEIEQHRHELERSNPDLEEFAYTASHDLKAPLRGISHLAQWIGEDVGTTASQDTIENLKLMCGRVDRMRKLLDGLLAYSRIGRAQDDVRDVDIAQIVREIISTLGASARIRCRVCGRDVGDPHPSHIDPDGAAKSDRKWTEAPRSLKRPRNHRHATTGRMGRISGWR